MLKTVRCPTFTCTFFVFCAKADHLQGTFIIKTMHKIMSFVHTALYFKLFCLQNGIYGLTLTNTF